MEQQLVRAAQDGDESAFIRLVASRQDRMYAVAYRITRDTDTAQDALQDAFVLAWRDLPRLRDPDRFDAWLGRIVMHVCVRLAARDRRRIGRLRALPTDGPAAPDEYTALADRDELERAFRRLEPDHRTILVLRHFLGYGVVEIADALDIPEGTAKSRLFHAHRSMRAALDADRRTVAVGGRSA